MNVIEEHGVVVNNIYKRIYVEVSARIKKGELNEKDFINLYNITKCTHF